MIINRLAKLKTIHFEEYLNTLTHGIGLILSVLGIVIIFGIADISDRSIMISLSIYSLTLIMVYLCSTLYHYYWNHRRVGLLQKLDHIAIYWYIAGTYTPYMIILFPPKEAMEVLAFIWGFAFVGTIIKLLYIEKLNVISYMSYLAMGWAIIYKINTLIALTPRLTFLMILFGGIAYTIGVLFYKSKLEYGHPIWHIFVILGSLFHYLGLTTII